MIDTAGLDFDAMLESFRFLLAQGVSPLSTNLPGMTMLHMMFDSSTEVAAEEKDESEDEGDEDEDEDGYDCEGPGHHHCIACGRLFEFQNEGCIHMVEQARDNHQRLCLQGFSLVCLWFVSGLSLLLSLALFCSLLLSPDLSSRLRTHM